MSRDHHILCTGNDYEACPLCMEDMDASDSTFLPCPCGYQICRFCWHRIREEGNEKCPACRRVYTDEDTATTPAAAVSHKPAGASLKRSASSTALQTPASGTKASTHANGVLSSRRHLVEIRVIQRNLVYVIGIGSQIANEQTLREPHFFGQFGRIIKIVVNKRNVILPPTTPGAAGTASGSAYVTFAKSEDAQRAIQYVDGSHHEGKVLRATFGTTKYCSYFLRGTTCPNAGCMYLHEEGASDDSFTKEELCGGKMQFHPIDPQNPRNAQPRQFGVLYKASPASVPPVSSSKPAAPAASPATSPSSIPAASIRTASASSKGPASPKAAAATGPTCKAAASPSGGPNSQAVEPVEEYADQALQFLTRLERWNRDADISSLSASSSTLSVSPPSSVGEEEELLTHASNIPSTFDPFAPLATHIVSSGRNSPASVNLHGPIGSQPVSTAGPTNTATQLFPGFNWTVQAVQTTCDAKSAGGVGQIAGKGNASQSGAPLESAALESAFFQQGRTATRSYATAV